MALPTERKLVRSAGTVSAAILFSRVTGLAREMVMARLFGAGAVYDAFLLGFRIPNLARNLFAEGALSSAFVPVFTNELAHGGKRPAAALSNALVTALVLVVGGLCAAGILFTPDLIWLLAPGFAAVPGKFELAVTLTRIMFPFLLLVTLAAQAMGVLNACDRFGVPAASSALFNIGSVAFGLLAGVAAGHWLGQDLVLWMAWGVLFGGLLQLLWQFPMLVRLGFAYRPRLDFSHPGLRRILALMGPAILGNAAVQINVLVNTNFASGITDASGRVINGPVSWLAYSFRFMQMPLGLFGVALASATLPAISRSASAGRLDEFRRTLAGSLRLALLLTIPSSVGLAVLSQSMVAVVYQWGRFSAADTRETALTLSGYAVGLAGYAAVKILAPAFYALNDARTPMLVSIGSVGMNVACAYALLYGFRMGHVGLAVSTSVVALAGAAVLLWLLRARLGGIEGRSLAGSALRVALASAWMGGVCLLSSHCVLLWLGDSKPARLADLAISIPLAVAAFFLGCKFLRIRELDSLPGRLPARRATLQ